MIEYDFTDKEGNDWVGYRPKFKNEIKKLESKEIIVQGYMFPLDQGDKQSLFLLGPFPLSCPYHPHTQSNLLIEVHASKPVFFSYDAINIQGELELVPKDDEYNMFYRLKNAKRIKCTSGSFVDLKINLKFSVIYFYLIFSYHLNQDGLFLTLNYLA